jgi:hypothetical protein
MLASYRGSVCEASGRRLWKAQLGTLLQNGAFPARYAVLCPAVHRAAEMTRYLTSACT